MEMVNGINMQLVINHIMITYIKKGLNNKHYLSKTFKNRRLKGGATVVGGFALCTVGATTCETGVGAVGVEIGYGLMVEGFYEVGSGKEL